MIAMVCHWQFDGNEEAENECGNAKNMRRVMKVISFPLIGLKTIFPLSVFRHPISSER
jgi:hypothetical protein